MTLVVRLTVRRPLEDDYRRFEREAARIMARYGGFIERMVRVVNARGDQDAELFTEVHLVTFPDQQAFSAYRHDPDLLALQPLRAAAVAETEILAGEEQRPLPAEGAAEVLGIDHLYLSVRSLEVSERFYDDLLLETLAFRKNRFVLGGDQHVQYYNRQMGFVIRPARARDRAHDPGLPGLHHLCFRVDAASDVDRVASALVARGIQASAPRSFLEYAPDYYATFVSDPDGVRLEVTNFRLERKERMFPPP